MHPALKKIDHRPWPVPQGSWALRQSWLDLLFAHWPIPAASLQPFVPAGVEIQEFEGTSWVGVVPFRMEEITFRPVPPLPWVSAFAELNLRLYVTVNGKPGVWFISLDASNPLAVWAAQQMFHLPYFYAEMDASEERGRIFYKSSRLSPKPVTPAERVAFRGSYSPKGPLFTAKPGTLEHFLTERYCLYTQLPDGRIARGNIHHQPWPLQLADAEIKENTIGDAQGIKLVGPPPLLHFSKRIDVVVWLLEPC
jgi:uncharacterized protein YqjF (DUF2071 family)